MAVREFVRQNYPNVLRERYTTANTHHARLAIAAKTKDKLLFEQDSYAFVVKKDRIQLSKPESLNSSFLSLVDNYEVEKSRALTDVLRKNENIENKTMSSTGYRIRRG